MSARLLRRAAAGCLIALLCLFLTACEEPHRPSVAVSGTVTLFGLSPASSDAADLTAEDAVFTDTDGRLTGTVTYQVELSRPTDFVLPCALASLLDAPAVTVDGAEIPLRANKVNALIQRPIVTAGNVQGQSVYFDPAEMAVVQPQPEDSYARMLALAAEGVAGELLLSAGCELDVWDVTDGQDEDGALHVETRQQPGESDPIHLLFAAPGTAVDCETNADDDGSLHRLYRIRRPYEDSPLWLATLPQDGVTLAVNTRPVDPRTCTLGETLTLALGASADERPVLCAAICENAGAAARGGRPLVVTPDLPEKSNLSGGYGAAYLCRFTVEDSGPHTLTVTLPVAEGAGVTLLEWADSPVANWHTAARRKLVAVWRHDVLADAPVPDGLLRIDRPAD